MKKKQESEPLGKIIRSRSRLKKKSGARADKKFTDPPALGKNYYDFIFIGLFVSNLDSESEKLCYYINVVGGN